MSTLYMEVVAMTISRGMMRVVLAAIVVGGSVVTVGVSRNTVSAKMVPACNCDEPGDCGSGKWKCTHGGTDLCSPSATNPPCPITSGPCRGYCESNEAF